MTTAQVKKLAAKEPHKYTEKDWQGQDDARTLVRAEKIRADSARMDAAKLWAAVELEKDSLEKEILNGIIKA